MRVLIRGVLLIIFVTVIFTGCSNKNVNNNRYSSMVLDSGILYYYNDGYVYKYADGKSFRLEKASSIFFSVINDAGEQKIVYSDEADKAKETPYDLILEDAIRIEYDDNYVYARYPGGVSKIVVYSINKDDEADNSLTQIDEIV